MSDTLVQDPPLNKDEIKTLEHLDLASTEGMRAKGRERCAGTGGALSSERQLRPQRPQRRCGLAPHSAPALLRWEPCRQPSADVHRAGSLPPPVYAALGWHSRSCLIADKLLDHERAKTFQYLGLLLCKTNTVVFSPWALKNRYYLY